MWDDRDTASIRGGLLPGHIQRAGCEPLTVGLEATQSHKGKPHQPNTNRSARKKRNTAILHAADNSQHEHKRTAANGHTQGHFHRPARKELPDAQDNQCHPFDGGGTADGARRIRKHFIHVKFPLRFRFWKFYAIIIAHIF